MDDPLSFLQVTFVGFYQSTLTLFALFVSFYFKGGWMEGLGGGRSSQNYVLQKKVDCNPMCFDAQFRKEGSGMVIATKHSSWHFPDSLLNQTF
jgi:hypothetical protein